MLARALTPIVRNGTKILIGGAADTGTLCAIGRATKGHQPNFFVIDKCAAPIRVIEEYCSQKNIHCHLLLEDLFNLKAMGRWDVIVLNYTYTFITPALRTKFFSQVASSLNSEGVLICLARITAPL